MTERTFKNTPAWAKGLIEKQEAEIRDLTTKLAILAGEIGETNICYRPYDKQPVYLPDNEVIRFRTGPEDRQYIDVTVDKYGVVEVRGGAAISIEPAAANSIRVTVPT